ncbi:hypothetical protein R3P38DRAFT_693584 [Favolaschia claudopus]|uniref:Uncharacterized protein n=1 Tax=Favolaschia claudopus TaxID=2862362 RepID=A0AAW0EB64_9AGAR
MSPDTQYYDDDEEEVCPDYHTATSLRRSVTVTTTRTTSSEGSANSGRSASHNVHWHSPSDTSRSSPTLRSSSSHAQLRRTASTRTSPSHPLPTLPLRIGPQRYIYTYTMLISGAPLAFLLSVEPSHGKPTPGKYTIRLSLKVDDVERPIGEPISLRLSVDPRKLDFAIFVFPGKNSVLPEGCLYSLRVWLRANGVDHRIFGEDDLWIGADLDFGSIENASFACLRPEGTTPPSLQDTQVYDAIVGRARVQFLIRWSPLGDGYYRYTMEYAAGGVGNLLMDDLRLQVDGDPRRVDFLVYTVPVRSVPAGASHRLRVWLKTRAVPSASEGDSGAASAHVYQRVWRTDTFKIGARLDFEALGPRLVMGSLAGPPQTVAVDVVSPVGYQRDVKQFIV